MLRNRRGMTLFLLLALSARVFTGAAEAQVNFSSVVADAKSYSTVTDHNLYPQMQMNNSEDANPSPEEKRNTVIYKKYLTPENAVVGIKVNSTASMLRDNSIAYQKIDHPASPLWVLRAHSPPTSPVEVTNTSTSQVNKLISWESEVGTSTIYIDIRGSRSL
jgi:hypothetical protein